MKIAMNELSVVVSGHGECYIYGITINPEIKSRLIG
jgi:hypothetical protein